MTQCDLEVSNTLVGSCWKAQCNGIIAAATMNRRRWWRQPNGPSGATADGATARCILVIEDD